MDATVAKWRKFGKSEDIVSGRKNGSRSQSRVPISAIPMEEVLFGVRHHTAPWVYSEVEPEKYFTARCWPVVGPT